VNSDMLKELDGIIANLYDMQDKFPDEAPCSDYDKIGSIIMDLEEMYDRLAQQEG